MHVRREYVFILLIVAAAVIWIGALAPDQHTLTVAFLDVGDGLCAVIHTPSGKTLVFDCGSSGHRDADRVGETVAAPYLTSLGVDTIDVAVLSHPHADHVCGFPVLLQLKPAKLVMDIAAKFPSAHYRRFLEAVKKSGAKYRIATRGQKLDLGDGTTVEVLHPDQPLTYTDLNNCAIMLRVLYKHVAFLLAADVSKEAESDILATRANVRAQVLQVGHHGSNSASSIEFLNAVRPDIAVISCAKRSRYGFPAPETIDRLHSVRAKVYVTGLDGAVVVTTDGTTISTQTHPCSR